MQDKDIIIAQLLQEIARLRDEVRLLKEEVARLKKNSNNSSRPPSSDIVKPEKTARKVSDQKRKRGGQRGHRKFTRRPFAPAEVDEVVRYELTDTQARGFEPLDQWHVLQQVGLPEKMYRVTEHRARKYRDPVTGRIHIAPMPDDIRKGGLLGADITAAAAFMKGSCHMSFTTIGQFFKEVMKLDISRGMLCKATQKVSDALSRPYDELVNRLPNEPLVNVDETGHHDGGKLHWTWCFDTSRYSLFRIDKSRGSKVLEEMLGEEFSGIIGSDYWGAYRKYGRLFNVRLQYCMAHLIREIRFLAEHSVRKLSDWGSELLQWLKKLFDTLHRRDELTADGFARSMGRIKAGFLRSVRRGPEHRLARKLARRFEGDRAENYFRFLTEPVEPTNNAA